MLVKQQQQIINLLSDLVSIHSNRTQPLLHPSDSSQSSLSQSLPLAQPSPITPQQSTLSTQQCIPGQLQSLPNPAQKTSKPLVDELFIPVQQSQQSIPTQQSTFTRQSASIQQLSPAAHETSPIQQPLPAQQNASYNPLPFPPSSQQTIPSLPAPTNSSLDLVFSDDLLSWDASSTDDDLIVLDQSQWSRQSQWHRQPEVHPSSSGLDKTTSSLSENDTSAGTFKAPPPFSTPPKLLPVEQVLQDYPGSSVANLRALSIALARDAIFWRKEMISSSLNGRKGTGSLDEKKLDYIKDCCTFTSA